MKTGEGAKVTVLSEAMGRFIKNVKRDRFLMILILPVIAYYLIFAYYPMYGASIAFMDTKFENGAITNVWVGFKYFKDFFNSIYFGRLVRNTFLLNLYGNIWGFPFPIMFALVLNELRFFRFKRITQTISYLPYFISVVVIAGMIVNFLSPQDGIINMIITKFGHEPINFLVDPKYFRTIYIASGIWQGFGMSSIIYLAALSGIDVQLYESAKCDGASRIQQMWHITLPGILTTIVIILILSIGNIMNVGFEKIILLYNPATYEVADVISTYIYRKGLLESVYNFGTAVGLFNSTINFALVVLFNYISRKITDISLW